MWHALLAIKTLRQDQAQSGLYQQRRHWQAAQTAHAQALATLGAMRAQAQAEEIAQYRALCQRLVHLSDIQAALDDVAYAKVLDQAQQARVQAAQQAEGEAQQSLNTARERHQEARRVREKFVDLSQQYDQAQGRAQEMREDLELEEIASRQREREDWDAPPQASP